MVSSVLAGAIVDAAIGGALIARFARSKVILAAGDISTISALGTAFAPSVICLVAAKLVSGVGIGMASFISPINVGELAPTNQRGALVAANMLAIITGIVMPIWWTTPCGYQKMAPYVWLGGRALAQISNRDVVFSWQPALVDQ